MPTTKVQDLRDHPAYVALQNRLDIQHDVQAALGWPEGSLERLADHQNNLEQADYLRHLPSASAFFVYSSPKPGVLIVHCALPLVPTEHRAIKDFATATQSTPYFTPSEHVLIFPTLITIYWQSAPGRVIPPL